MQTMISGGTSVCHGIFGLSHWVNSHTSIQISLVEAMVFQGLHKTRPHHDDLFQIITLGKSTWDGILDVSHFVHSSRTRPLTWLCQLSPHCVSSDSTLLARTSLVSSLLTPLPLTSLHELPSGALMSPLPALRELSHHSVSSDITPWALTSFCELWHHSVSSDITPWALNSWHHSMSCHLMTTDKTLWTLAWADNTPPGFTPFCQRVRGASPSLFADNIDRQPVAAPNLYDACHSLARSDGAIVCEVVKFNR